MDKQGAHIETNDGNTPTRRKANDESACGNRYIPI